MNEAFSYRPAPQKSNIIVLCDHATNIVPDWVAGGDLGVSAADMERHIAYDVGALGVSEILAERLGAHLIASRFSRLVIDPNRGADDPTLIMRIYDKTIIPANKGLKLDDKTERIKRLHTPYHTQIAKVLTEIKALGETPLIISMHSFTDQLRGRPKRPWHIGILSAEDRAIADLLIEEFDRDPEICVGDNEPYHGALAGDTLDQHGISQGVPHGLIEVRNDLIDDIEGQRKWADICYTAIHSALKRGDFL